MDCSCPSVIHGGNPGLGADYGMADLKVDAKQDKADSEIAEFYDHR